MYITLKRLEHSEINLLRVLRNAERFSFFDTRIVTPQNQEHWWMSWNHHTLQIQFYTIWLNKVTPVGFLSVKLVRTLGRFEVREIGNLLLAPAHRGRGIMHAALTEVRRLYNPLTFWVAHVKSDNVASLNLFARQGFIQYERSTNRRTSQCHSLTKRIARAPSTKPNSPTSSSSLAAKSSRTR
jgi:RimJ/RimL family protein N-acetyltransferase